MLLKLLFSFFADYIIVYDSFFSTSTTLTLKLCAEQRAEIKRIIVKEMVLRCIEFTILSKQVT
jgi:hypothetical protein